jgi:phytoene dehydrogenase-like protein
MSTGHAANGPAVDAVVVGAGPNGLAAAAELVRAGRSVHVIEGHTAVGGGTRTEELTVPGVWHDVCSAVHPFGVASPFLRSLPLADHGLEWVHPEIDVAHPLDGGRAGLLFRSITETAASLGDDGASWERTFGPLTSRAPELATDILGPLVSVPRHPITLARFGVSAVQPASLVARRWQTPEARELFAGIAAHVYRPLQQPLTASAGMMFVAMGHTYGWPVAKGGSRAITDALAAYVLAGGGTVETGRTVTSLDDLPPHQVALFDVGPRAFARIAAPRLPGRVRRAYERYRHGPGAFKVDLAIEGGIPWQHPEVARAGTVHLGGTFEEVAAAEADVYRGRMPVRPFVLVAQQYVADPTRSAGDVHPVWAYAHVPTGWPGDATEAILDQIERFAPGTRDRIVGLAVHSTTDLEAYNPNYVGGDVATGANDPRQILFRPRVTLTPYDTGIDGVYLCSAATPPGAGVHGMAGFHAARRALKHLGG